jgi:hypothetical protein
MRQDTGNIFPEDETCPNSLSQREELEGEIAARIIQTKPLSCDAE